VTTVKTCVLLALLLAVLSAACGAQTENLKFMRVSLRSGCSPPTTIHFYCSQDYDKADCLKDSLALCQALAPYPTRLLGDWSYFLVKAYDWKPLVRRQNGNNEKTIRPAFSLLLGRATVIDQSLFSPTPERAKELELWSGLSINVLVDVAVTHEIGHAMCQDRDELRANDYGKELRKGKIPDCSKTPGWKPRANSTSVAVNTSNAPR
jgi:hypothetical protein